MDDIICIFLGAFPLKREWHKSLNGCIYLKEKGNAFLKMYIYLFLNYCFGLIKTVTCDCYCKELFLPYLAHKKCKLMYSG